MRVPRTVVAAMEVTRRVVSVCCRVTVSAEQGFGLRDQNKGAPTNLFAWWIARSMAQRLWNFLDEGSSSELTTGRVCWLSSLEPGDAVMQLAFVHPPRSSEDRYCLTLPNIPASRDQI